MAASKTKVKTVTSGNSKPPKSKPSSRSNNNKNSKKTFNLISVSVSVLCVALVYYVYTEHLTVKRFYGKLQKTASELERLIVADERKFFPGLGEAGAPSNITQTPAYLRGRRDLETVFLNVELSKHISYNRTLSDGRNGDCKRLVYDLNALPTTSVIIIFYNEPFSVLLRTVHSVLNTADDKILHEIILVDDCSDAEELLDKLNYYMETRLPAKVKLVRLSERSGIPKARLAGAHFATGKVLLFLDAHCECMATWLEPLIDRIRISRKNVVVPLIDVIDAETLEYQISEIDQFELGGFTWDGHFDWIKISDRERNRQKEQWPGENVEILPTQSPTMAGGLFAIDREYFWEIGSYDDQMDGWGGENLEMSFRIWQCGGVIETVPCSRIGHIFRTSSPYADQGNRDTHAENTLRLALVWMDDYVKYLYMINPEYKKYANDPKISNVTKRKELREAMNCQSFEWYMKNVYPEKFIPDRDVRHYGRVLPHSVTLCMDSLGAELDTDYTLGLSACASYSLVMSLTNIGALRTDRSCATIRDDDGGYQIISMTPCLNDTDVTERWVYTEDQQIQWENTKLCIDYRPGTNIVVFLSLCDHLVMTQKFEFMPDMEEFEKLITYEADVKSET